MPISLELSTNKNVLRGAEVPISFRVAAVAGVAEGFRNRQMVWRGRWRRPQQLGGQIEQIIRILQRQRRRRQRGGSGANGGALGAGVWPDPSTLLCLYLDATLIAAKKCECTHRRGKGY